MLKSTHIIQQHYQRIMLNVRNHKKKENLSTPFTWSPLPIIRLTALLPPPPTPMTFIRAPSEEAEQTLLLEAGTLILRVLQKEEATSRQEREEASTEQFFPAEWSLHLHRERCSSGRPKDGFRIPAAPSRHCILFASLLYSSADYWFYIRLNLLVHWARGALGFCSHGWTKTLMKTWLCKESSINLIVESSV